MALAVSFVDASPARAAEVIQDEVGEAAKRPKYMDTRRGLDMFKDLVLMSVQELVEEGRLNPATIPTADADTSGQKPMEKRQYMGICMRNHGNSFIPFPCLRQGRR